MDDAMSLEFKTFLVNSYGGLTYGHPKEAVAADIFRIDVPRRSHEGIPSFPICVAVKGLDRFVLDVANLPVDVEIERLIRSKRGEVSIVNSRYDVSVTLDTNDFEFILRLASIIRERIASEEKVPDSHEQSTEARTAESLSHFARLLKQYSAQTRRMEKTRTDGLFAF